MHGNVAEWVLDSYVPDAYGKRAGSSVKDRLSSVPERPTSSGAVHGKMIRTALRSAARRASTPAWNRQDPQNPKSIWYLTDGGMIGFRVVRPLHIPDVITMHRLWNFSKGEP